MKMQNKTGIGTATLLLALYTAACGGTQGEPKTPDDAAAQANNDTEAAPVADSMTTAPTLAPLAERSFQPSKDELLLLCGVEQSVPGGLTLEAAEKELLSIDKTVEQRIGELRKAPANKCSGAADQLREQFESDLTVSRSWCDQNLARGVGIKGDELAAQTEELVGKLRKRSDEMKGNAALCVEKRAEQIEDLASWRNQRNSSCMPTPAQQRFIECGVQSSSAEKKGKAAALCKKNTTPDVREAAQKDVAQCLGALSRSADERGLERAVADGATASLETRLLTGTAEFFETRAKEEAKLFAYEVVKDHLCAEDGVKALLVNTCELFGSDETLAATPAAIVAAVRADLERLPELLVGRIREKNPTLACSAALTWTFGREAIEGSDVFELLTNPGPIVDAPLVKDPKEKPACTEATRTLIVKIAGELKKRLEPDRARFERSVKSGDFTRALGGDQLTRDGKPNLPEYADVLAKVLMRVQQLDRAHQDWKQNPSREKRAAVVTAGLRTIEPIVAFAVRQQAGEGGAQKVGKAVDLSITLTGQLVNREYSAAVVTAAALGGAAGISSGKVQNLLGLAAGLAQAQSSDEVRATLEDAALPLGSWRRKNEKRVGFTLTGLVGFQAGEEVVIEKTSGNGTVNSGPSIAPTLLIGPDIHYGLGKGVRVGAQLSILDLGALLSFRASKPQVDQPAMATALETAEQKPEVRVEQVFSPGIYPYFGFGPFTVGPAFSFVPALRQAGSAAAKEHLNVVRVGAFAAIDVSVLPLY